jgi:FkbM family methyltransferase
MPSASLRARLRAAAGRVTRRLPAVRGATRITQLLDAAFGIPRDPAEAIVGVSARDGSRWILDLRTTFERQAFWSGRYDDTTLSLLESYLTPGSVVIDVGANVGFYTVRLGRALKRLGGGTLHAFEPVPGNAARLAQNIAANDLGAIVQLHETALGSRDGRVAFVLENEHESTTGNAAMIGASGASSFSYDIEVDLTTLDGFAERVALTACTLLKLDVEGAELEVLRGATATIARFRPVILAEYNERWAQTFGWNREAYALFARDHAYASCWLDQRHDPACGTLIANVLLVPSELARRP